MGLQKHGDLLDQAFRAAEVCDATDDLCGYDNDEGMVLSTFEELDYSTEDKEWLARFLPVNKNEPDAPVRLTYAEVSFAGSILEACNIRPSQCLKALAAFHKRYDMDLKELRAPEPAPGG